MPLKESQKELLPPFGKLHTVPAMKKVALGLVIIKRVIPEIKRAEDYLSSGNVSDEEFERTTLAIAQYGQRIDKEAAKLITLLEQMGKQAKTYEKELKNALG